jgi:hypothetical protein
VSLKHCKLAQNFLSVFSLQIYRKCPNDVPGLKWAEALKAAGPEKGPRQPGLLAIRDGEIVYAILSRPLFRPALAYII